MKTQTYHKEFSDKKAAHDWMVMKNQTQRDGTIYCLVSGAELDWAVVDLDTAIELGMGYEWSTSNLSFTEEPKHFTVRYGMVDDPSMVYCIILTKERKFKPICSTSHPNAEARVKRFISSMEKQGYQYIES